MMTKFNTTGQSISVDQFSNFVGFYQDSIEITYKGSYMTLGKILTTFTANTPNVYKSSRHVDVALFLLVSLGFGAGFAAAIVVKWGRVGR